MACFWPAPDTPTANILNLLMVDKMVRISVLSVRKLIVQEVLSKENQKEVKYFLDAQIIQTVRLHHGINLLINHVLIATLLILLKKKPKGMENL